MGTILAVNLALAVLVLAVGALSGCAPVKRTVVDEGTVDAYMASMMRGTSKTAPTPFVTPPVVMVESSLWDSRYRGEIVDAVAELNESLPPTFQLSVRRCPRVHCFEQAGEISVRAALSMKALRAWCKTTKVGGCANNLGDRAQVVLSPRAKDYTAEDRRGVFLHEMLHALGIEGHPDPSLFPDSIMATWKAPGKARYTTRHTVINALAPIDRAALHRLYAPGGLAFTRAYVAP